MRLIKFLAVAAAVCFPAASIAQAGAGDTWPEWTPGYMDIHHINTGRGECMFAIFPDGTTMMMDAGETGTDKRNFKPDGSRGAGEWIARYMLRMMRPLPAQKLDYMLLSHFHDDHIGNVALAEKRSKKGDYLLTGITEVGEFVPFGKIVDRAWPDYDYPYAMGERPNMKNYLSFVGTHVAGGGVAERFEVGSNRQFALLRRPDKYPDFEVRNIAANGVVWTGVHDNTRSHFPPLEHLAREKYPEENICSAGIRVSYGRFDYFNGADPVVGLETAGTWKDIEAPTGRAVGPVEVCVANHHAKDSMGEEFVGAVRPQVFVIQGFALSHPDDRALSNMLSREIYPEERDVFIYNIFDVNRVVNGERLVGQMKSTRGHIVIRVQPGGESYKVYILDDSSESFTITSVHGPYECK